MMPGRRPPAHVPGRPPGSPALLRPVAERRLPPMARVSPLRLAARHRRAFSYL